MPMLSISLDPDHGIVLLFVPNSDEDTHYHIRLPYDGATDLMMALRGMIAGTNSEDVYDIRIEEVM